MRVRVWLITHAHWDDMGEGLVVQEHASVLSIASKKVIFAKLIFCVLLYLALDIY